MARSRSQSPRDARPALAALARSLEDLAAQIGALAAGEKHAPDALDVLATIRDRKPEWERAKALLSWSASVHGGFPKARIAEAMGITRPTLYALWERHGLAFPRQPRPGRPRS